MKRLVANIGVVKVLLILYVLQHIFTKIYSIEDFTLLTLYIQGSIEGRRKRLVFFSKFKMTYEEYKITKHKQNQTCQGHTEAIKKM